jgi:hypothetical protein
MKKSAAEYFKVVDFVNKFTLTGGEPLLNKELGGFIFYLKKYKEKIGYIEIITNGTIVPSRDLIAACEAFDDVCFLVDDYGENLSKNADEVIKVLTLNNIKAKRRVYYGDNAHMGGWVDFGDFSFKNCSEEQLSETYGNCSYADPRYICYGIYGEYVSLCSASRRCAEKGITNYGDLLDLFDEKLTREEKQNWFIRAANKPLAACAYCNGMLKTSARYPAGEQILGDIKNG